MNPVRTLGIAAIGALLCGCTSTESAIGPLGFGPKAKAELSERNLAHGAPPRETRTSRHEQRAIAPSPAPAAAASGSPATAASTVTAEAPPRPPAAPDSGVVASSSAADWIGLWTGKDTTRFQIPSFPSEPMMDDLARVRVDAAGTGQVAFVLIDSSNDQDLCSLSANLSAPNQAQILSGQPCFGSEDESFELSVHVKSGMAKLQGSTLTLEVILDALVTSDQVRGNGTVEYRFEGRR